MAEVKTGEFKRASRKAILDPRLQQSLKTTVGHFHEARENAIEELSPEVWEALRDKAKEIKEHTLNNLDYYLGLLIERVEQAGGMVHLARDASEANAIVSELVQTRGVRRVAKGKSMVSEEMGLNHALEQQGVEVLETDLGEYIIQLAGETPFHIVAPAMHKRKEEVSSLFARHLGTAETDRIEELTAIARATLREKFLSADMGITGANFMVAETGTIVVITNEGNGGLCSSAPRIHLAVTGMEKLIPSLEDLSIFLRLLPRAATGQRLTSYVTLVTGPRRPGDEDGPEEFHLLILDNGRSRLLADPALREVLHCIRCGACLNVCPVYRKIGGHAYGWVYPGPIGAIVTPMFVGPSKARDLPFASSLCGACRDVCPVKINLPHMLLQMRHRLAESGDPGERSVSHVERLAMRIWQRAMRSPGSLGFARRIARLLQWPFARKGKLGRIPLPPLSRWTRSRDFPALAEKSFHQLWEKRHKGGRQKEGR